MKIDLVIHSQIPHFLHIYSYVLGDVDTEFHLIYIHDLYNLVGTIHFKNSEIYTLEF
jgi:hypothetical protein